MIWDFVLRLAVAGVLGALIGLDREYRSKQAGYRTHFLVCLGSALIMIVSQYGFSEIITHPSVSLDPSRVAAQVVSGIGFIGAGTIIIQKRFVRGLTTAAGLWATAGIGLAIGSGMFWLGIAATVLTLIALEALSYLFGSLGMRSTYLQLYSADREAFRRFTQMVNDSGYRINNYEMTEERRQDTYVYRVNMIVRVLKRGDESRLLSCLQSFPYITLEKME